MYFVTKYTTTAPCGIGGEADVRTRLALKRVSIR